MPMPVIRLAIDADDDRLIEAVIDQQEYERKLHDTRLPGPEIARAYLKHGFDEYEIVMEKRVR